jgi:hypothetical protein
MLLVHKKVYRAFFIFAFILIPGLRIRARLAVIAKAATEAKKIIG